MRKVFSMEEPTEDKKIENPKESIKLIADSHIHK